MMTRTLLKRFLDDMAEYLEDNGDVQVDVSDIDGIESCLRMNERIRTHTYGRSP